MNFSGARGTFPIEISIHSDKLCIQIYGQKTDLKVLNIFSIKTYQIFPAGQLLISKNKNEDRKWYKYQYVDRLYFKKSVENLQELITRWKERVEILIVVSRRSSLVRRLTSAILYIAMHAEIKI